MIHRAGLFEKLSQALVDIGDVLPRMDLSACLYQTEVMEAALSRLFTYIILFLRLCVRWYKKSPLDRISSAIQSPFELGYHDLVNNIQECSKAVDDLASAGARAEIRDVRTLAMLQHAQIQEFDTKLAEVMEGQKKFEAHVTQLLQVATSRKSITERIGDHVSSISKTVHRIEAEAMMRSSEPTITPESALLKLQSFVRRDLTPRLPSPNEQVVYNTISDWSSGKGSSLLIVQVGLRAQMQAKELASIMIAHMRLGSQCVFWDLLSNRTSPDTYTMKELCLGLVYQAVQHSNGLLSSFAEQLNLAKTHATDTEREWVDLICVLFSKLPSAFMVIEAAALQNVHKPDSSWGDQLSEHLPLIVQRSSAAGCVLKVFVILHGNSHRWCATAAISENVQVVKLQPPTPVPPHLRHMKGRSGSRARGRKIQKPRERT